MKKQDKKLTIILFVGLMIILILPLIFMSYFFFNAHINAISFDTLDKINREVDDYADEINHFLQGVQGDVLFLSELSSLNDLINSKNIYNAKTNLEKDFLSFSNEKKIYYQIRYIDENGQEIVRIDSDKQSSMVIHDNLQNKKERYYFKETMNHKEGGLYISPLDLNIENNGIENRGTEDEPIYVPVIRYATPVFDDKNNAKGIVITNIYADYFLENIQEKEHSEIIFLLNNNGFYLSHPVPEKEFGFMFGNDENVYRDYPKIASGILSNEESKMMQLGDLLISFKYIYPTREIVEDHNENIKDFVKIEDEDYFWVLVGVISRDNIPNSLENLKNDFLLIIIPTIVVVSLFLFFLFRRIKIMVKDPKERYK